MTYKTDSGLKKQIHALGERYLGSGFHLIHGDFYPGSWLKTQSSIKIIDPEFGFFGLAEYDLGVTMAHLKMAEQDDALISLLLSNYPYPRDYNAKLCDAFCGVEIMRRIIGIAQLPLALTLEEKTALLKDAQKLILSY